VWGLWFAAASLGVVTVAPLLIGLGDAMRERLPCHELMEGCPRLRSLDHGTHALGVERVPALIEVAGILQPVADLSEAKTLSGLWACAP